MAGRWADTTPAAVAEWLGRCSAPWWFAGGHALDLWLGRETRVHSDIEIGCFRADLDVVLPVFADWDIQGARNKGLTPYDPASPPTPPFSLWLRRPGSVLWDLELLAESRAGSVWQYRRDPRVTLPLDCLVVSASDGRFRVIAPEVQLLYKAKDLREKDVADFVVIEPHLSQQSREWLRGALVTAHPHHEWIARLG